MFRLSAIVLTVFLLFLTFLIPAAAQDSAADLRLARELPGHISQLTNFGQRADWSHDGKRILFIEKTYGDVFEVNVASAAVRPITHHYYHEGYTRALYLSNGDILLSGSRIFDAQNPHLSRDATAELWVLDKSLTKPPVPLGVFCSEGPAVSRTQMRIAWTSDHENYPDDLPEQLREDLIRLSRRMAEDSW